MVQKRTSPSSYTNTRSGSAHVTNTYTRRSNFLPSMRNGSDTYFCATTLAVFWTFANPDLFVPVSGPITPRSRSAVCACASV